MPVNLPVIDPITDALLIIDLQRDFQPGGALAVAGGYEITREITQIMPAFKTIVATQDWHPRGHLSFATSHAGKKPYDEISLHGMPQTLWPVHCVGGSQGAELDPFLPTHRLSLILRKGTDPRIDSYSAFYENYGPDKKRQPTGLMGFLLTRRVRRIFVCGLARDFCVKWTAIDAAGNGALKTVVLWNLTRAVNPENDAKTEADMRASFVEIIK